MASKLTAREQCLLIMKVSNQKCNLKLTMRLKPGIIQKNNKLRKCPKECLMNMDNNMVMLFKIFQWHNNINRHLKLIT